MKNRTIVGILCMVTAVVITFAVAPLVNRLSTDTTPVIRLKQDVKQGTPIADDCLEVVAVGKGTVPRGAIADKTHIVGKYAASDLYAGDYISAKKLADDGRTADDVFATLDGKKVAISVTVHSLAAGLSGKLENGDIITFYVVDKETKKVTALPELRYMRVVTTTTSNGVDKDAVKEKEDGTIELPSTITVLANGEQAKLLAQHEGGTAMHAALVFRGSKEVCDQFIAQQDAYFQAGGEGHE